MRRHGARRLLALTFDDPDPQRKHLLERAGSQTFSYSSDSQQPARIQARDEINHLRYAHHLADGRERRRDELNKPFAACGPTGVADKDYSN